MSGNTITVVGNVTRDPELRFTPSGQANARMGVAVNRRWQDRGSGEWQEQVSFFDVICWRELAENVSGSIKKGTRVVVTGRLEQRSYDDKEGNKRNVVEIIADEVAPSLRWATATVERTERRGPNEGGSGGGGGGGGGGGAGGGGYGRPASDPPPYEDFGDEPF